MRRSLTRALCLALLCAIAAGASAPPHRVPSPVADAAMQGDAETVRALLREGADVNAAQGDGMTALHWAARHDDADMARMLVLAGARLGAVTRNGQYTPLHLAARNGGAATVRVLLDAGATVDARTSSGAALPLHFAAEHGDVEVVAALLDAGAEVDATDQAFGQTPLMWAAALGRVPAITLLLERGADIAATSDVEDIPGREEQDRTLEQRRNRMMAALRAATEQPRGSREEQAAEEKAAADSTAATPPAADSATAVSPEPEPVDSAVPEPPKPAATDSAAPVDKDLEPLSYGELVGGKGGLTPLLFAVRQGHMEAVRTLLDAGADIDQRGTGDETTPLLAAVVNGHFDLALVLLGRGADPNLASRAGAAPLYATLNLQWAPKALYPQPTAQTQQRTTYLELMQALIEAGADVNARLATHLWYMSYNFDLLDVNTAGATPFWRAAYATDVEAMRMLLARGADPDIATLRPAERRRRADPDRGEGGEPKLDPSGLPPVPVGGPGVWPIHAAAGVGYGEGYAANAHRHAPDGWMPALRLLVEELGADVNARDHNGYTPLHHAAARGDEEMILYLVEKGADVTAVSRRGQTTADMANGPVQRVQPFPSTVELLEKLGSKNNNKCLSC